MNSVAQTKNLSNFVGSHTRSLNRERTLLFRYIAEINLIFGAWYLSWQITHSINFGALWLSIPLLLAEIYSYFGGVMFVVGLCRLIVRQVKSLDKLTPPMLRADLPTVDVFIACYNEPPEIVEQTARAALAIDYPPTKLRVCVLDDGNSPAMRAMSEKLSIKDLQKPLLQQEATQIERERSLLIKRLQELAELAPDTQAAEKWLQEASQQDMRLETKFLQRLGQLILLLHPTHSSISDRLSTERQFLEDAIYQTEIELIELNRLRYIARFKPPGVPHHAKAGNINYALFYGDTAGDFILTLDADRIPKPQFLKRVLPYFFTYNVYPGKSERNRVTFVQTPQDFYNLPPDDPFGHQGHLFYRPLQRSKNGMSATFYTGTNAVIRWDALIIVGLQYFSDKFAKNEQRLDEFELVSGVSSHNITEDMNTAMRLHAAG